MFKMMTTYPLLFEFKSVVAMSFKGPPIKYIHPKTAIFESPPTPVLKIRFGPTPTLPLNKLILLTHFQNAMNVKNPRI